MKPTRRKRVLDVNDNAEVWRDQTITVDVKKKFASACFRSFKRPAYNALIAAPLLLLQKLNLPLLLLVCNKPEQDQR